MSTDGEDLVSNAALLGGMALPIDEPQIDDEPVSREPVRMVVDSGREDIPFPTPTAIPSEKFAAKPEPKRKAKATTATAKLVIPPKPPESNGWSVEVSHSTKTGTLPPDAGDYDVMLHHIKQLRNAKLDDALTIAETIVEALRWQQAQAVNAGQDPASPSATIGMVIAVLKALCPGADVGAEFATNMLRSLMHQ